MVWAAQPGLHPWREEFRRRALTRQKRAREPSQEKPLQYLASEVILKKDHCLSALREVATWEPPPNPVLEEASQFWVVVNALADDGSEQVHKHSSEAAPRKRHRIPFDFLWKFCQILFVLQTTTAGNCTCTTYPVMW